MRTQLASAACTVAQRERLLFESPRTSVRLERKLAQPAGPKDEAINRLDGYFPNAFFSNGSISPLAAMGSRISVSP
jgi:hypothetical protein